MKESRNHKLGFIVQGSSDVCCQYTVIHSTHVEVGSGWGEEGGRLHFPKKSKTSSLQWHLEGINQRCRTGRIYPLWTMSGPSRHSCLELQRCLERQINAAAAAAAGAKLSKHQGCILSDFISSGIHPKKETQEGKKNPCKSSISPAESDGMFRICPPRGVGTGLFHRLGRGRLGRAGPS